MSPAYRSLRAFASHRLDCLKYRKIGANSRRLPWGGQNCTDWSDMAWLYARFYKGLDEQTDGW